MTGIIYAHSNVSHLSVGFTQQQASRVVVEVANDDVRFLLLDVPDVHAGVHQTILPKSITGRERQALLDEEVLQVQGEGGVRRRVLSEQCESLPLEVVEHF